MCNRWIRMHIELSFVCKCKNNILSVDNLVVLYSEKSQAIFWGTNTTTVSGSHSCSVNHNFINKYSLHYYFYPLVRLFFTKQNLIHLLRVPNVHSLRKRICKIINTSLHTRNIGSYITKTYFSDTKFNFIILTQNIREYQKWYNEFTNGGMKELIRNISLMQLPTL